MDFTEAWDDTCSRIGLAARAGDLKLLKKLIKEGLPVNVEDNRGWKPLHEAAARNHYGCVKQLLTVKTVDVNWRTYEGHSALLLACHYGHSETVDELLKAGAEPDCCDGGTTTLIEAASCKSMTCIKKLVDKKANVNLPNLDNWTPLHEAVQQGFIEALSFLLDHNAAIDAQDDNGRTPFFVAAEFGQLAALKILYGSEKMKVDINDDAAADGTTPLIIASQGGHADCVAFLVDNGSKVDRATKDGLTAVHLAAYKGNTEVLKLLLKHCSAEAIETAGNLEVHGTPLHVAAVANREDSLAYLVRRGFKIDLAAEELDLQDTSLPTRITPLGKAAKCGAVNCMKVLLNAGAQPNAMSNKTAAPLTAAMLGKNESAVRLLLEWGASVNYSGSDISRPEAFLIGGNLSCFELLLKAGGDVSSFLNEEPVNVIHWLTSASSSSVVHPDAVIHALKVLMNYVSNCDSLIARLAAADPLLSEVARQCRSNCPTALVHLSRLAVRNILSSCGKSNMLMYAKQLSIPACLQEYLVYDFYKK